MMMMSSEALENSQQRVRELEKEVRELKVKLLRMEVQLQEHRLSKDHFLVSLRAKIKNLHQYVLDYKCNNAAVIFSDWRAAKSVCDSLGNLWADMRRLCMRKDEVVAIGTTKYERLNRYVFQTLLQLYGCHYDSHHKSKAAVLPFNVAVWMRENCVRWNVHAAMSNMLSWVEGPGAAYLTELKKQAVAGVPRQVHDDSRNGVILIDELVEKQKLGESCKTGESKYRVYKTTHMLYNTPKICEICTSSKSSSVLKVYDLPEQLLNPRLPIPESASEKILETILQTDSYLQKSFDFHSNISLAEAHFNCKRLACQHLSMQARYRAELNLEKSARYPSYWERQLKKGIHTQESLMPLPGHITYENCRLLHMIKDASNSSALNQKLLLEGLRQSFDHFTTTINFLIGDVPIADSCLKGLYSNDVSGNGLNQFVGSIVVLYGPLHNTISMASLTVNKYYKFFFAEYRHKRSVLLDGVCDNDRERIRMFRGTPYTNLGYQLLEFGEIREGWLQIRKTVIPMLEASDHPLCGLLLSIMEENIPLCLDLLRAYKAANVEAAILILERMAGLYLTLPWHSKYRRAVIYTASKLRSLWEMGDPMQAKIKEMLPNLLDVYIETFFGLLVQHLPRSHRTEEDILKAADRVPQSFKDDSVAREVFGTADSQVYKYNLQPESRLPSEECVELAKVYIQQFVKNLLRENHPAPTPQYSAKGVLTGFLLHHSFNSTSILPKDDLPYCLAMEDRLRFCCVCALNIEIPLDVRNPNEAQQTVCTLPCGHLCHRICQPTFFKRDKTNFNTLKLIELQVLITKLGINPLAIGVAKRNLVEQLQAMRKLTPQVMDYVCNICKEQLPPLGPPLCLICMQPLALILTQTVGTKSPYCKHRFHQQCLLTQGIPVDSLTSTLEVCPIYRDGMKRKLNMAIQTANRYMCSKDKVEGKVKHL